MARQNVKLSFPFRGIVENTAYADQPPGTTFDALNARPFDPFKLRMRGGQRYGIEDYLTSAVNGTKAIQNINDIVLAFQSGSAVGATPLGRDFTDASVPLGDLDVQDPNVWHLWRMDANPNYNFNSRAESGVNTIKVAAAAGGSERSIQKDSAGDTQSSVALYDDSPVIDLTAQTTHTFTWRSQLFSLIAGVIFVWRVSDNPTDDNHFGILASVGFGASMTLQPFVVTGGTLANATLDSGAVTFNSPLGNNTAYHNYRLEVNGNTFTLKVEGATQWVFTDSSFSTQDRFGWGVSQRTVLNTTNLSVTDLTPVASPATLREHNIAITSGGNIYNGTVDDGVTVATGGTGAVASSGIVRSQAAFQKIFYCDGTSSGYKILDTSTGTVTDWQQSLTAGALPTGGTGAAEAVTAVNTGTKTFTVAGDKSGLSANDFIEIRDSTGNDRSYTVASTSGTGPTNVVVNETIPSSIADGDMYESDVGCTIIVLYRGRLVMAGLETDRQNWFMAKLGKPLDWDYSASFTVTIAVAGNANQAGRLDDIITALIPYLDDVLYIGGDHSIWMLQGDPADQGSIDNVSRQIGVIGPDAWTFDEDGNIYWLAQNGLYRLRVGSTQIESISKGRLDDTLTQIDFGANNVRLQYDRETQGVHIFIVPTTEGATPNDQWFWDKRTDSFWRDQYPTQVGPTAVRLFDSDTFDDRVVALGGWDSFVRNFDRNAKSDDGTAIDSYAYFTPFTAGDRSRVLLQEVTINLAEGSDSNAVLQVFEAATAEDLASETIPKAAQDLSEGRNNPMLARVAGNSVAIRIRDNTVNSSWGYENGSIVVDGAGIERREETK